MSLQVGFNDPANVTRKAEIVYCSVRNHNLGIYIWVPTICIVVATLGVGGEHGRGTIRLGR